MSFQRSHEWSLSAIDRLTIEIDAQTIDAGCLVQVLRDKPEAGLRIEGK